MSGRNNPTKEARKARNYEEGLDDIERLVAFDFRVQEFGDYHFRINGRLDVWPTTRRWYDLNSRQKGIYGNLYEFTREFFAVSASGNR